MSFARHCCVNISNHWRLAISEEDKVFLEVLRQERVMGEKVCQRVYKQNLASVVCEEVTEEK